MARDGAWIDDRVESFCDEDVAYIIYAVISSDVVASNIPVLTVSDQKVGLNTG
jgi:hypothetical protein